MVALPIAVLPELVKAGEFYVQVTGITPDTELWVNDDPAASADRRPLTAKQSSGKSPPSRFPSVPSPAGTPFFQGRQGTFGQQLKGVPEIGKAPVAIYRFRNTPTPDAPEGRVPMELRVGIERSGLDAAEDNDDPTILSIQTRDPVSGKISEPVEVRPGKQPHNVFPACLQPISTTEISTS